MVDLDLNLQNGSTIVHSSRSGILRYQSQTQRIMRVFAKGLPLLVGLTEESQVITIKLVDSFMGLKVREATMATFGQYRTLTLFHTQIVKSRGFSFHCYF